MSSVRGALVVFIVLALAASSSAQEDLETQQARSLFEAGRAAFEAAHYEDALRFFRESYQRSGRSALLYNIGVSADRLRRDQEALEAFQGYLRDAPADAPQRADAEVRVGVLCRQLNCDDPPPEPRDPQDPPPPAPRGDPSVSLAGWGIFGGGLAVLATGAIFLGLGQADADFVEGQPRGTDWSDGLEEAASRAEWMRITGWVLAGVGLAAAIGGITLALITPSATESAALEIRPGSLAFVWRGQ